MMGESPLVACTSPHDWKYISEGGSTIVFSYSGSPHPTFDGTALRLRKTLVPAHKEPENCQLDEDAVGSDEEEEQDDPTIVFQRTVIERLVPRKYLPKLDAAHVERSWLKELAALTEPHRPVERRAKDRIDVNRKKAVLATDLVGGKGWAVEIKPKWGFLPAAIYLSPETREIKTRTCRFCMHADLKTRLGEDASVGYCPLDLFAHDTARVTSALRALWDVWDGTGAAVNNLRVFVEGMMIKPCADPTSLVPLAEQLFPPGSPEDVSCPAHTPGEIREAFIDALLPLLVDTPVLCTLSTLQRSLDALDVEGLSALWARVRPDAAQMLGKGEAEPDMGEWTRFVDAYLGRQEEGCETGEGAATEDELRYRLVAYLLSASFKDCSIIVRMRRGSAGTITVIDLDVKSMGRLGKWARMDREIVDAYGGRAARNCVDGLAVDKRMD